ncbi:MAG: DUF6879 family protein [Pseudonocardiaceae bacterium]
MVSAGTQAGKVFRRARIVSEPISNYQKWVLKDSHLYAEAGEDIRCIACPVGDPPKAGTSLGQCRMPPRFVLSAGRGQFVSVPDSLMCSLRLRARRAWMAPSAGDSKTPDVRIVRGGIGLRSTRRWGCVA